MDKKYLDLLNKIYIFFLREIIMFANEKQELCKPYLKYIIMYIFHVPLYIRNY